MHARIQWAISAAPASLVHVQRAATPTAAAAHRAGFRIERADKILPIQMKNNNNKASGGGGRLSSEELLALQHPRAKEPLTKTELDSATN